MANSRMYLKCTLCGERFHLGRYYPSTGWFMSLPDTTMEDNGMLVSGPPPDLVFVEEWRAFLDKHSPIVRRDEQGSYVANGKHVVHGGWTQERSFDVTHLGKVFELEYE